MCVMESPVLSRSERGSRRVGHRVLTAREAEAQLVPRPGHRGMLGRLNPGIAETLKWVAEAWRE
jgi:hypothetical protein